MEKGPFPGDVVTEGRQDGDGAISWRAGLGNKDCY